MVRPEDQCVRPAVAAVARLERFGQGGNDGWVGQAGHVAGQQQDRVAPEGWPAGGGELRPRWVNEKLSAQDDLCAMWLGT